MRVHLILLACLSPCVNAGIVANTTSERQIRRALSAFLLAVPPRPHARSDSGGPSAMRPDHRPPAGGVAYTNRPGESHDRDQNRVQPWDRSMVSGRGSRAASSHNQQWDAQSRPRNNFDQPPRGASSDRRGHPDPRESMRSGQRNTYSQPSRGDYVERRRGDEVDPRGYPQEQGEQRRSGDYPDRSTYSQQRQGSPISDTNQVDHRGRGVPQERPGYPQQRQGTNQVDQRARGPDRSGYSQPQPGPGISGPRQVDQRGQGVRLPSDRSDYAQQSRSPGISEINQADYRGRGVNSDRSGYPQQRQDPRARDVNQVDRRGRGEYRERRPADQFGSSGYPSERRAQVGERNQFDRPGSNFPDPRGYPEPRQGFDERSQFDRPMGSDYRPDNRGYDRSQGDQPSRNDYPDRRSYPQQGQRYGPGERNHADQYRMDDYPDRGGYQEHQGVTSGERNRIDPPRRSDYPRQGERRFYDQPPDARRDDMYSRGDAGYASSRSFPPDPMNPRYVEARDLDYDRRPPAPDGSDFYERPHSNMDHMRQGYDQQHDSDGSHWADQGYNWGGQRVGVTRRN